MTIWPTLGFSWGPSFYAVTGSVGVLSWIVFLVIAVGAIILLVTVNKLILNLLYSPPGVFALDQSFPKVLQFLTEKLQSSADHFSPMGKGTYDTIPGRKIMMTIPLQVLVSMGGFVA